MKIKTETLIKYYLNKSVSSLGGWGAELCERTPFSSSAVVDYRVDLVLVIGAVPRGSSENKPTPSGPLVFCQTPHFIVLN